MLPKSIQTNRIPIFSLIFSFELLLKERYTLKHFPEWIVRVYDKQIYRNDPMMYSLIPCKSNSHFLGKEHHRIEQYVDNYFVAWQCPIHWAFAFDFVRRQSIGFAKELFFHFFFTSPFFCSLFYFNGHDCPCLFVFHFNDNAEISFADGTTFDEIIRREFARLKQRISMKIKRIFRKTNLIVGKTKFARAKFTRIRWIRTAETRKITLILS